MRYTAAGLAIWALGICGLAGAAQAETIRYAARLGGSAEVPAVAAPGRGVLTAELDTGTRMLRYRLTYSGLSGAVDGAHFHGPAGPGANAPHLIMLGLAGHHGAGDGHETAGMAGMAGMAGPPARLGSPVTGSAMLTAAQIADLQAGRWYVNVHTKAHPAGEIRGQLLADRYQRGP